MKLESPQWRTVRRSLATVSAITETASKLAASTIMASSEQPTLPRRVVDDRQISNSKLARDPSEHLIKRLGYRWINLPREPEPRAVEPLFRRIPVNIEVVEVRI